MLLKYTTLPGKCKRARAVLFPVNGIVDKVDKNVETVVAMPGKP